MGRRHAAALVLALVAALLIPGAVAGKPTTPGDPTPPVVTPMISSGTLGTNGWYVTNVTVRWSVTDPESEILSTDGCDIKTLSETSGTMLTCSASSDGGTSTVSKTFKVDKTAPTGLAVTPTRQPNASGWYRASVTIDWSANDTTSGIDSCTSVNYSGPETGGATLTGKCTDKAGNATPAGAPFSIKYDATAPSVTATPDHPANANGWYRSTVSIAWSGSDTLSGLAGCDPHSSYSGPNSASASLSGSCTDKAGNVGSKTFALSYDASAPVVTPTPAASPDANGWYNHPLAIDFVGSDSTSGIDTCTRVTYAGPDSGSASVAGSCRDRAGNQSATSTFGFSYDATAPQVTGSSAGRAPDANGWYNHALSVTFSGTDATSGVASCTQGTYSGPDSGSASVSGSCRDRAGNQSGSTSFPLAYDATPPTVSKLRSTAGNRRIDLTWAASADTQLVQVTRTKGTARATVYSGKATGFRDSRLKVGAKYHYTVTASDAAGNSASKTITVTATGALLSPVPGARIGSAPLLRWTPVKGARYYNIQLLHGRTVLSAWPTSAHFKVPRSWTFHGQRYRLKRGVYRWYVWPGFGRFSASRYGHLLGGSSFVFSG